MYDGDIVIHLHQALDDTAIHGLLRETGRDRGTRGSCVSDRERRLMLIDFDGEQTTPSAILHRIRHPRHRAELVGF
jgi:hypothetical protein